MARDRGVEVERQKFHKPSNDLSSRVSDSLELHDNNAKLTIFIKIYF